MADTSNKPIMPVPDDEPWTFPEGAIRPTRQYAAIDEYDPNVYIDISHTPTRLDTHTTTTKTTSTN